MRRRCHGNRLTIATSFAAIGALACAGGGRSGPDAGESCMADSDCVDAFPCTSDSCGVDNLCRHVAVNELCMMGEVCEPGRGCVTSASCSSDADCADEFPCTLETCGVGGVCNYTGVNERCASGEVCDVGMGCIVPPGCASDAECNDSIPCTRDTCAADMTCHNTPMDEMCGTGERCSSTSGCYTPMPCTIDADCDDGNFCNGTELCDPEFGCGPPDGPRVCNDSNDCTMDRCDATADRCSFECDTSRPECMCPTTMPTCSGNFRLPGAMGFCAFGLVSWNFTNVTFTFDSGVIEVTGWTVSSTATVPPMADPGPACPDIDASTTLPGMCSETYRIQGTFVDDDTFMGTFSTTYTGSGCLDCPTMSLPVTGTRI